jgi:hypothetical protein
MVLVVCRVFSKAEGGCAAAEPFKRREVTSATAPASRLFRIAMKGICITPVSAVVPAKVLACPACENHTAGPRTLVISENHRGTPSDEQLASAHNAGTHQSDSH